MAACFAIAALVGACVIREDNGLAWILQMRPMALVGVLSYGMYLFNSLSIHAAEITLGNIGLFHPLFIFPFALAICVTASYASHRYFETPFLNLKRRFSHASPSPAEDPPATMPDPRTEAPLHQ